MHDTPTRVLPTVKQSDLHVNYNAQLGTYRHRLSHHHAWAVSSELRGSCYPHMPIGKVWIYRLLFVCLFVCNFVILYGYGFLRRG